MRAIRHFVLALIYLLVLSSTWAQVFTPFGFRQVIGDSGPVSEGGANGTIIFVSSTDTNGNLGGLAAADTVCVNEATAAGLANPSSFAALLSDNSADASARFNVTYPLNDVDGVIIDAANVWDAVLNNGVIYEADGTEATTTQFWTGTLSSGAKDTDNCSNWGDGTSGSNGTYGVKNATDSTWIDNGVAACNTLKRFLCVGATTDFVPSPYEPNPFDFIDQFNVPLSDLRESNIVRITGIDTETPVSITASGGGADPFDITGVSLPPVTNIITIDTPNSYSLIYNNDGTKMYVSSYTNGDVQQYSLSTAYDVATATNDSVSLSLASEMSASYSILFNNDGTKLFALDGGTNDTVFQYTLSTPYDLSTGSYDAKSLSVATEDNQPYSMLLNSDGTKLYILGSQNDSIYSYTLSTPYDVSTGSYDSVSVDLNGLLSGVQYDMSYNNDGTKLLISDSANRIFLFSLSPAYDVMSATFDNVVYSNGSRADEIFFNGDGSLLYTIDFYGEIKTTQLQTAYDISSIIPESLTDSLTVTAQETLQRKIAFNNTGTKMFLVGLSSDAVHQYSLSRPWDITTASYDSVSFDVSTETTTPRSLEFNSDGSKMYIVGSTFVYEYDLSTGFDITTAVYNSNNYDVSTEAPAPYDVKFNNDGTKMYIICWTNDDIYQYTLSTAYDVTSATYDSVSLSVVDRYIFPYSMLFNNDGSKMFVSGYSSPVTQYDLATNYDISTATPNTTFSASWGTFIDIKFNDIGSKMYLLDYFSDDIFQVNLLAPFDITKTASSGSNFDFIVPGEGGYFRDLAFNNDGTKMYLAFNSSFENGVIYQYSLSTAYDITTYTYDNKKIDVFPLVDYVYSLGFNTNGTKMYIGDSNGPQVWEYTLSTPWDVTTAVYSAADNPFNNAYTSLFLPDGTGYITDGNNSNGTLLQYFAMSTPWDLSTAGFSSVLVNIPGGRPGLAFNADGTSIYTINSQETVYQYPLITPYDLYTIDTVNYKTADVSSISPLNLEFKPDGTKVYFASGSYIYQVDVTGDQASAEYRTCSDGTSDAACDASVLTDWTQLDGTIDNAEYLQLRMTSSNKGNTQHVADVTVGTLTADWIVETLQVNELKIENLLVTDITENDFEVSVDWSEDNNSNYNWVNLYYCNKTVAGAGCTPSTLIGAMTKVGGQFVYSVVDIAASPLDVLKIRVTADDPDGEINSPLDTEITLLDAADEDDYEHMPDPFDFIDQFGVALSTPIESNIVQITGLDSASTSLVIRATGGNTSFDLANATTLTTTTIGDVPYTTNNLTFNNDGTKVYSADSSNDRIRQYNLATAYDVTTVDAGSVVTYDSSTEASYPRATLFNDDGTKMYVACGTTENIYQYTLSTAYDISTASYDTVFLDVGPDLTGDPFSMHFNNDGSKLFVGETNYGRIYQYSLSTAYDMSTATYDANIDLLTTTNSAYGIDFNPAGTKMYIYWSNEGKVYQYGLSSAFDITTATFEAESFSDGSINDIHFSPDGSILYTALSSDFGRYVLSTPYDISTMLPDALTTFSTSEQESNPQSLVFNTNGTKMYIVGTGADRVFQYSLSRPFDPTSATFNNVSFNIASQTTNAESVRFNTDGTKMYILNGSSNTTYQYSLSTAFAVNTASYDSVLFSANTEDGSATSIQFNADGSKMYIVGNSSNTIYEYDLSPGFDLSTATYNSVNLPVGSEDTGPIDIHFNADGTKMFVQGDSSDSVHQYTLGTAYSLATASYDSVLFSFSYQSTFLDAMSFSANGNKMYLVSGSTIYQYSLSTAYDIANAVYSQGTSSNFRVSAIDSTPDDIKFNADGTKLFLLGSGNDSVYEISLSTAYDLSTAVYSGVSQSVTTPANNPSGLAFKSDGTKMYILNWGTDRIYQYTLSPAWDITSAIYDTVELYVGSQESSPEGISFKPDGTRMYIVGTSGDDLTQYYLSTPWDISTAVVDSSTGYVGGQDSSPFGLSFNNDGSKLYMVGLSTSDRVHQYSVATPWDVATLSYDNISFDPDDANPKSVIFNDTGSKMFVLGTNDILAFDVAGSEALAEYRTCTNGTSDANCDASVVTDWTSSVGTILNNHYLQLKMTSASAVSTLFTAIVDVGLVTADWLVETLAASINPITISNLVVSNITENDFDVSVDFSGNDDDDLNFMRLYFCNKTVAGAGCAPSTLIGDLTEGSSIYYISVLDLAGTNPGDVLKLRVIADDPDGEVGSPLDTEITLHAAIDLTDYPALPDPFDFIDQFDVALNTEIESNIVQITDLDTAVQVNISGMGGGSGYNLSNLAASSASSSKSVSNETANPYAVTFNNDGSKMYVADYISDVVHQYSLSVNFDVTTATYDNKSVNVNGLETQLYGVEFNNDGTVMYVTGSASGDVHQYNLSTAYDVSTATFDDTFIMTQDLYPADIIFNSDGTKMYMLGRYYDRVYQYTLSTAYDVGSASYDSVFYYFGSETGELEPTGMQFNNDGTKLFVTGYYTDSLHQFSLSTAYDISTMSYDAAVYDFSSLETNVYDFSFNANGTMMYMVGSSSDAVHQYVLATPYDPTSVISTKSLPLIDVSAQDNVPYTVRFNPTGTQMYIVGGLSSLRVHQYSLTTPYDTSTATYNNESFYLANEEPLPRGMAFNGDGTKMFIVGTSSDLVHQYSLATPYDVTTATYDAVTKDISAEEGDAQDIHFNNDGTKMYIFGFDDYIEQYNLTTAYDITTASYESKSLYTGNQDLFSNYAFTFNGDGTKVLFLGRDNSEIYQYTLSTAWDVSTGSFDGIEVEIGHVSVNPSSLTFSADGSQLTILDLGTDYVQTFNLSTPYDITTMFLPPGEYKSFDVYSEETNPESISLSADGTKLYVIGQDSDSVFQYNLSTPFEVSTATLDTSFSVNSEEAAPRSLAFDPTGTKMYVLGQSYDKVIQYSLTTPWDVDTASYETESAALSAQEAQPESLAFNADGTKMYILGWGSDSVHQYTLSPAWDASTASYDTVSFSVNAQNNAPYAMTFNGDGTKLYVVDRVPGDILEYDLGTPYDVNTMSWNGVTHYMFSIDNVPVSITFAQEGKKFYMLGGDSNRIYQFDLDANSVPAQYRICSDGTSDANCDASVITDWTSTPGSITNNQYLQLKVTSANTNDTTYTTDVTVGLRAADWIVETQGTLEITVSNLVISNETATSFDISVDFVGDNNDNALLELFYCNQSDGGAGCSPSTSLGTLDRGAGVYTKSITGLSSPNDPGETLKLSLVVTDTDGQNGPLAGTATLNAPLPPQPADFQVVAVSDARIDLSWNSGGGSTAGYRITYNQGATYPTTCSDGTFDIGEGSINGTAHEVTGLTSATTYSFALCAINSNGTPDESSIVTGQATTPTAVTSRAFVSSYAGKGNAIADPGDDLASANARCASLASTAGISDNGGTWKAMLSFGSSIPSNFNSIVYPVKLVDGTVVETSDLFDGGGLSAAINLEEDGVTTVAGGTLVWTGADWWGNANSYNCSLWTSGGGGADGNVGDATRSDNKWINIGGATPQQACTGSYRMYCLEDNPTVLDPGPENPEDLVATVDNTTQISLSWTAPTGATGYRIAYQAGATAPSDCSSGTTIGEGSISGTSHTISGLTASTQYSFRVCAIDATPNESIGTTVSATTASNLSMSISNLVISAISATGFTATFDYIGDTDTDGSASLFFCNSYDLPGCNPAGQNEEPMSRSGNTFTVTVSGLGSPNDPGETLNVRVVATDPDNVYGSPLDTTVQINGTDDTPNIFDFTDLTNQPVDTLTNSDIPQVTGIDMATPVSLSGQAGAAPYEVTAITSYDGSSLFIDAQVSTIAAVRFNSDGSTMYALDKDTSIIHQYSLATAYDVTSATYNNETFSVLNEAGSAWDMRFKNDGTTMYISDTTNDTIYQYTLSTAWDITSASYASKFYPVATQDDIPVAVDFNSDGTKMYVLGYTNKTVFQYTLSTAWDVSTASYASKSFSVNSEETNPFTITLSDDGTKMYMSGSVNDTVFQYSLSTAWDISTASYDNTGYYLIENYYPYSVDFNSDGSKMYIASDWGLTIYQYDLSTAWDVSTTTPIDGNATTIEEVSYMEGFAFNNDGTKLYAISGNTSNIDYVYQYSLSTPYDISTKSFNYEESFALDAVASEYPKAIEFNSTGTKMFTVDNFSEEVHEYSLSAAWDVSSASYTDSFDISPETTSGGGLRFNNDGTKMYVGGGNTTYQYELSTGYDISTASYSGKSYLTSNTGYSTLTFNNDGTKVYLADGSTTGRVYQHSLSTAWDISTGSYDNISLNTNGQGTHIFADIRFNNDGSKFYKLDGDINIIFQYDLNTDYEIATNAPYDNSSFEPNQEGRYLEAVFFNNDGSKMYLLIRDGVFTFDIPRIYQYSLSTAFDVTTATYDNKSYLASPDDFLARAAIFNNDGTKLYVIDSDSTDAVYQHSLSTAWDISTASYDSKTFSLSTEGSNPNSISFNSTGTKMYILDTTADSIFQYSLSTAWDISTASYDNKSLLFSSQISTSYSMSFNNDGTKVFVLGTLSDSVFEYDLSTAWDISTASYDNVNLYTHNSEAHSMAFNNSGSKLYIATHTGVYQYDIGGGIAGSPEYRICSDGTSEANCDSTVLVDWTTQASEILNGQYIQLRLTSSSLPSDPITVDVTVGTVTADWIVTTSP